MSRSFLRQDTQISASFNFDDALTAGLNLQSSSYSLEDDLNSIRSQLRLILHSTGSGKWYSGLTTTDYGGARGLDQLGTDLEDIERKRLIYRVQKNTVGLKVPTGQNYVTLSVGSGFAPGYVAAVSTGMSGTVVSSLSGSQFNVWSSASQTGNNVLVPKNLVVVVSASTGNPIQSEGGTGFDIYALLQVSSSVADGDTFDDSTKTIQLSFVKTNDARNGLVSASIADIEGRTIQYSYARRIPLDNIPDDAYLDNVFVDVIADISSSINSVVSASIAVLSSSIINIVNNSLMSGVLNTTVVNIISYSAGQYVTLNQVINNQTGTVNTNNDIQINLATNTSWSFSNSSGSNIFNVNNGANNSGSVYFNVDYFNVVNNYLATFMSGIQVSISGNYITINNGTIVSSGSLSVGAGSGSNLNLSGGFGITITDDGKTNSTYTNTFYIASGTNEWNQFVTNFGQVSLFQALNELSQSITGSKGQRKATAVVTTTVNADVNVTYPTNLDAPLLNFAAYPSASFVSGVNVYVNGQLQRPGANGSDNHDVYPGTTSTSGDLKFEFKLHKDDVITMIIVN